MVEARLHPLLIAAFFAEGVDLEATVAFQGLHTDNAVPFNACEKQGAPDAGFKWNLIVKMILGRLA